MCSYSKRSVFRPFQNYSRKRSRSEVVEDFDTVDTGDAFEADHVWVEVPDERKCLGYRSYLGANIGLPSSLRPC